MSAYAPRALFHRNKQAITIGGCKVVDIVKTGPFAAPTDDEMKIGRLVP